MKLAPGRCGLHLKTGSTFSETLSAFSGECSKLEKDTCFPDQDLTLVLISLHVKRVGECSGANGSVVVPVSILCIQQSTGCLCSSMGELKKKDSWTKLLKYLIVLSQRPQNDGMLSLASTEFRKKRKTTACQHLRIGTFHMKTWISGFSRKTIRSSLARPRIAHSHSGLELRTVTPFNRM